MSRRLLEIVEFIDLNLPFLEALFVRVIVVDDVVDFFLSSFLEDPLRINIFSSQLGGHKIFQDHGEDV